MLVPNLRSSFEDHPHVLVEIAENTYMESA